MSYPQPILMNFEISTVVCWYHQQFQAPAEQHQYNNISILPTQILIHIFILIRNIIRQSLTQQKMQHIYKYKLYNPFQFQIFQMIQTKSISDGQRTKIIYTLIKDGKYQDAINHLNYELQFCPRSRSMSLLAYCYFMSQDFLNSARVYEQLAKYYPDVTQYKLYLAQSHYKNGDFIQALKVTQSIQDPAYQQKIILLQSLIRYQQDQIQHAKSLLRQGNQEDPDIVVNEGCILYKEGKFEEARVKFYDAMNATGYNCELAYNISLCHYKMKQLAPSLKYIAEIIQKGVKQHPELGVGSYAPDIDVKSVGNSQTLKQTALIEAFNLKAAIQYTIKNYAAAREALLDMPPRSEEQLDSVTLLNQALMNIDEDANGSFKKLNFLLSNPPFLPQTFSNLLLLYCKFGYYDLAADVLAQNSQFIDKMPNPSEFTFIDAIILQKASPQQSLRKLDIIANGHIDTLRQLTKSIQDARLAKDNDGIKKSLKQFDDCLDKYIPVLMSQAKIYWDKENYSVVEKLFRQSAEFCADHDVWKLNVAHVFFVLERYNEAIRYYEPIVKKNYDNMLSLTAIVVANLCVSYIMVNKNEDAEEIMKRLEVEEEKAAEMAQNQKQANHYHLCIVNLVIGTLYCSKTNYDFGVGRIIKSLEPLQKKLNTDTWFYAKRCFLALLQNLSKHMIVIKDTTISQIVDFLDLADEHGKNTPTVFNPLQEIDQKHTVSYQARQLKRMYIKMR